MAKGTKSGGRKKGTPNRLTAAFKDAVRTVYHEIGGDAAFAGWARENQGDFYKIAARLIPTELTTQGEGIVVVVNRGAAIKGEA